MPEELMNTILFCDLIDTSIPTLLYLLSFPLLSKYICWEERGES